MKNLYTTLALLSVMLLRSQDLHFSQFNENPSLVNPALTGANTPMRAAITNREQWRSITAPYRTFGASFETRFNRSEWQQVDKFRSMTFKDRTTGRVAAGLSVYTDKAGDGNLGLTQANLSLASFVPVSKTSFVSLGFQGSMAQRKVDNSKLIYPNQYNGMGYDADKASNENFASTNFTYKDLAAGAVWTFADEEKEMTMQRGTRATLGVAVYHILQPKQQFFNSGSQLYRKFVVHGDCSYGIPNRNFFIVPSFLMQQQGSSLEFLVGGSIKYCLNNNSRYTGYVKRNYFSYGAFYRNGDALILSTQLEWKEQMAVGLSYDVNVSPLVAGSSSRGGFELTLRYTTPGSYLYQKKKGTLAPATAPQN